MLSYSQIKVLPRQPSFDTSGNKNIVDFEFPNGNYDLSQSNIQIETFHVIDSSQPVIRSISGDNSGVYETSILMNDSGVAGNVNIVTSKKSQLIRNGQISSSNGGVLDNAVDHNSFKTNLNSILTSDEINNNETEYGSTILYRDRGFIKNQSMQILNTEGNFKPKQRSNIMNIPLKDIFPLCQVSNWQSDVYGDLNMHLEMRLQTLQGNTPVFPDATWAQPYNNSINANNANTYGALNAVVAVATGGDRNISVLTTMISYKDMVDSPFHVGQKLKMGYTVTGVPAVVDQIVKVLSIKQLNSNDATNGQIELTFDCVVVILPINKGVPVFRVTGLNPVSVNLEIRSIQLNLMEVSNPEPLTNKMISFDAWTSHKDNFTASTNVSQNFYIPPNTKACFVCFPEALKSISTDPLKSYRVIIDNEPVTESVVVYNSAKHFNLLQSACKNAGVKVENLNGNFRNWNLNLDGQTSQIVEIMMIAFPVALKQTQQIVQLELESDTNMSGNIQLNYCRFKQVTL